MVHVGEEIFYHPSLKFLVCKLHGNGLHPGKDAVKRHLRGYGHRSRGKALTRVLQALAKLPLASLEELREVQHATFGTVESFTQPIRYLKVMSGWRCVLCEESFLTTSLEIVQRHAAAVHERRRSDPVLWEDCLLQTLFSETKDRRYFCVSMQHDEEFHPSEMLQEDTQREQSSQEHESSDVGFPSISLVSDLSRSESDPSIGSVSGLEGMQVFPHISRLSSSQVPRRLNIQQAFVPRHPFMSIAEMYVPLPGPRLDFLLKSAAFRSASMPIFDSSPIDTAINMQAVFPDSEKSAVWANALLYSTVQIMNRGVPTEEGQLLQKKTIQLMNKKLSFPDETLCSAAVGAIMVLKATAYKTHDLIAHDMHAKGLAKVLDYVAKTGSDLTLPARKALFWLDLNAAAYVGSERQMSHLDLPPVRWRREIRPEAANCLPAGFARHRDTFPYGLPECIADLEEFQAHLREYRKAQMRRSNQYVQLEPMQGSIESRLAFQAHACRRVGPLAEAARLAIYICAYCSWMDTWNDSLLPCRLAVKVFDFIDSILPPNLLDSKCAWHGRIDLTFWLIFISSSAAELDDGQVEGIKTRRNSMLKSISRMLPFLARDSQMDLKTILRGALNDFIYVDGWLERRSSIPLWHKLEVDINVDIQ